MCCFLRIKCLWGNFLADHFSDLWYWSVSDQDHLRSTAQALWRCLPDTPINCLQLMLTRSWFVCWPNFLPSSTLILEVDMVYSGANTQLRFTLSKLRWSSVYIFITGLVIIYKILSENSHSIVSKTQRTKLDEIVEKWVMEAWKLRETYMPCSWPLCTLLNCWQSRCALSQPSGALNQALMIRTTESEQFTALLAIHAHAKGSVLLSFLSLSFSVQPARVSGDSNRVYWRNWLMLLKSRYCFVPFKSLFSLFCKQLYDMDKKKTPHD